MEIGEAISMSFKAIGQKEVSISDLSSYIKTFISDYSDVEISVINSRVSSYLNRNSKGKSAIYSRAINPKTKRPRKGVYCLAKMKKAKPVIVPDKQPKLFPDNDGLKKSPQHKSPNEVFSPTETLYFGKAGEYATVSELLFRGYNASVMSVDEGIDITASKGDKFFFIQVKSTKFKNDRISVSLKPNGFINNSTANIFFVVVFRYQSNMANVNRFVVFRESDLDRFVHTKLVSNNNGTIHIKIKQEDGALVLYNGGKSEPVDYFLDNFDLLK